MDAAAIRDHVADAHDTELDRLGSDRRLIAMTDADLTASTVLSVVAEEYAAAVETVEGWGDAALFAEAARRLEADRERVATELDRDVAAPADPGPVHASLRSLDGTTERLAGLVGYGLVADRTHLQVVNFFVNEAEEDRADLFRDLRGRRAEMTEEALAALADRDVGRDALGPAGDVIERAYDEYAASLEAMGLDPRPVC